MESGRSFTSSGTSDGTELSSTAPKVMGAISPDAYFQHPRRLSRIRSWNIAKVVFHTLCFGIALCVCCMDAYVFSFIRYFSIANPFQVSLPFALISALWTSAELVTIMVRRDIGRGIKPAWHVGVDLFIWIICIVAVIMSAMQDTHSVYYYNYDYGVTALMQGGRVSLPILFSFLAIFHFGLFVRACLEVDHAKSERHIARVFSEITRLNLAGGGQQRAPSSEQQQQQQQQQQQEQTQDTFHDVTTTQPQEAVPMGQPQIPRRPVGAPPAEFRDRDSGPCRIIDPDIEANLKFIAPFPIYASQGNLKYPQAAMKP